MKKVCVVTGTRAEYGLLRWVMDGIRQSSKLELQLVVTGMHLSHEFGTTVNAIEADGFVVDRKIEMLLSSDSAIGVTKSIGVGMIGFADALAELKPNLLLVLGDRFELLSATAPAMVAGIPIAHLHGGETTLGAFDEAIRHSITKMSHLHFVAAEEYRRRVIQLGEHPERVFNVGGLGVDNMRKLRLLTKNDLEKFLKFKLAKRNLLITFHPVTLERNASLEQLNELLGALAELEDTGLVFTMPNSDTEGRSMFDRIIQFCEVRSNARAYSSLGQLGYLSCLKHFDGVVGNSSSGLLEAPSFKTGTINIGDRQHGRLKADSVIDCSPNIQSIRLALERLFSMDFQNNLKEIQSPYGNGGASDLIVKILERQSFKDLLKKSFYNLATS